MQIKLWQFGLLAIAAGMAGCASNDDVRRLERRVAYLEGRLDERDGRRPPPMMQHGPGPHGPGQGPGPRPDGPGPDRMGPPPRGEQGPPPAR